jgi:hypothetical protein
LLRGPRNHNFQNLHTSPTKSLFSAKKLKLPSRHKVEPRSRQGGGKVEARPSQGPDPIGDNLYVVCSFLFSTRILLVLSFLWISGAEFPSLFIAIWPLCGSQAPSNVLCSSRSSWCLHLLGSPSTKLTQTTTPCASRSSWCLTF